MALEKLSLGRSLALLRMTMKVNLGGKPEKFSFTPIVSIELVN
jgi:hypothetical protein